MKLALVTFFSTVTLACAADGPFTQDELVRRTQELYDAIVPGNQAPWKKYFADDCIFADEKGRILDKPKLIADIAPLPSGYSGTLKHRKRPEPDHWQHSHTQLRRGRDRDDLRPEPESALSRH